MIYTLTMNPALDKTVTVNYFKVDSVNRVSSIRIDPGGKGINVSNMVKQLEGESQAVVATAGSTGQQLLSLITHKGIPYKSFDVGGQTRINTKIVDPVDGTFTDLNEPGPMVDAEYLVEIKEYLKSVMKKGDILVLAGSLPKGVTAVFYQDLVRLGNEIGAKVIVDADGENLKRSLLAKPFMIKPNEHELEMYFDVTLDTDDKLLNAARQLIKNSVSCVVISLGEKGSLVVTEDGSRRLPSIKLDVKSTVGAGDSMVAGIAHYLDTQLTDKDAAININILTSAVQLGVACSSASIEQEGTIMGSKKRVEELLKIVQANQTNS